MSIIASLPKPVFDAIALDNTNALYPLLVYASMVGLKVNARKDPAEITGIVDTDVFRLSTALGIVQAGGEVKNLPAWIKIPTANYEDEVPAYLPKRTYQDEQGNEVVRKWSEWKDGVHEHNLIGTDYYVGGNSFGEELLGTILAQLYAGGFTLLDTNTYRALLV